MPSKRGVLKAWIRIAVLAVIFVMATLLLLHFMTYEQTWQIQLTEGLLAIGMLGLAILVIYRLGALKR